MNIRPATVEDAEFLRTMLYEAATWNPDWPRGSMEEVLTKPTIVRYHEGWGRPGDAGVVAELESVPVGAAWYRLFTEDAPGYGFVDDRTPELGIAVDPQARRKSVGRALVNACEEAVRQAGGRMLIAETSGTPHYEPTRQFYVGVGYENEATIKDFYATGDDLKIFIKRI